MGIARRITAKRIKAEKRWRRQRASSRDCEPSVASCSGTQSAKLRLYHEFFLHGQRFRFVKQARNLIKRSLIRRRRSFCSGVSIWITATCVLTGIWPANASILSVAIPVTIAASRQPTLPTVSSMRLAPSSATLASIAARLFFRSAMC